MINWVYFPKSSPPPEFGLRLAALFEEKAEAIDSRANGSQPSNTVMACFWLYLAHFGSLIWPTPRVAVLSRVFRPES